MREEPLYCELTGGDTGLTNEVLATVDRLEEGVMVLMTDTDPVHEISLPYTLFPLLHEGDVVRLIVEKDMDRREETVQEVMEMKKRLHNVSL